MATNLIAGSQLTDLFHSKFLLFWDFDGVIKDSVEVKTRAYETLFRPYGSELVARIKTHHQNFGGISRFEKIPLYLGWAEVLVTDYIVDELCKRFSELALQGVIKSPWIGGVKEYLIKNYERQHFVIVTATPQDEIEYILHELSIFHCFREVYGSPMSKKEAISKVFQQHKIDRSRAMMIGDTETDMQAALANKVQFLLRRTQLNHNLQAACICPMFEDLIT